MQAPLQRGCSRQAPGLRAFRRFPRRRGRWLARAGNLGPGRLRRRDCAIVRPPRRARAPPRHARAGRSIVAGREGCRCLGRQAAGGLWQRVRRERDCSPQLACGWARCRWYWRFTAAADRGRRAWRGKPRGNGAPLSAASGFSAGSLDAAFSPAIDSSGNLWMANFTTDRLTEFIGVAAPVKAPLAGLPSLR